MPANVPGSWLSSYSQHAFTTGRTRHVSAPKSRPKGISQTLKVSECGCVRGCAHIHAELR